MKFSCPKCKTDIGPFTVIDNRAPKVGGGGGFEFMKSWPICYVIYSDRDKSWPICYEISQGKYFKTYPGYCIQPPPPYAYNMEILNSATLTPSGSGMPQLSKERTVHYQWEGNHLWQPSENYPSSGEGYGMGCGAAEATGLGFVLLLSTLVCLPILVPLRQYSRK